MNEVFRYHERGWNGEFSVDQADKCCERCLSYNISPSNEVVLVSGFVAMPHVWHRPVEYDGCLSITFQLSIGGSFHWRNSSSPVEYPGHHVCTLSSKSDQASHSRRLDIRVGRIVGGLHDVIGRVVILKDRFRASEGVNVKISGMIISRRHDSDCEA